ncbi:MAG: hypothetical protein HXY36_03530 [Chloroflexi bacterium]|nr:hypothetical protein [Chloroflexota bacterium]
MSIRKAKAKDTRNSWYIRCPVCGSRIELDECPIPGGMNNNNIEVCYECGADIEVQPPVDENIS